MRKQTFSPATCRKFITNRLYIIVLCPTTTDAATAHRYGHYRNPDPDSINSYSNVCNFDQIETKMMMRTDGRS